MEGTGGDKSPGHNERPSNLRFPEDLIHQRDAAMRAQFAADVKALEKARDSIDDEKCHAAMIKSYLAEGWHIGRLSDVACRSLSTSLASGEAVAWFQKRNPSYGVLRSGLYSAVFVLPSRYTDRDPVPVYRKK